MSRIAKIPLEIPANVEFQYANHTVSIKHKNEEFVYELHKAVALQIEGNTVYVKPKQEDHPMVGTTRKLLGNMVKGVTVGFEKKLQLVGVGYRAKVEGNNLELSLGFSNPKRIEIPKGIKIEAPSNTEIVVKGKDPQLVGQVAADIRAVRPPEPYKGKGVRYANEVVAVKEVKKK